MRKSAVPGVHNVKANGKMYTYAWRGGPRLYAEIGTKEFLAEYLKATKFRETEKQVVGTFGGLIADFKASPDYYRLAKDTKRSYDAIMRALGQEYGEMPLRLFEEKGIKADLLRYRDSMADKPRTANLHLAVLKRIISFGVEREIVGINKVADVKLFRLDSRRDKIWSDEECSRFCSTSSSHLAAALTLALWTGQRQGDLLRLTWNAYDGSAIRLKQAKTGAIVRLKCTADLRNMLDAMPRVAVTILTNSRGLPWTSNGFRASWQTAMKRAGITGLTFHDLKGTFCSRARSLGYSLEETADAVGSTAGVIKKHYVASDVVVTSIRRER